MMALIDKAFYNLQKNLDIEYVKTGKKDWFHSGYRLFDYWEVKEAVEELKNIYTKNLFTKKEIEKSYDDNMKSLRIKHNNHNLDVIENITKIFGDFEEAD